MSTYQQLPIKTKPKRPIRVVITTLVILICVVIIACLGLSYYITTQLIHPKHKSVTLNPGDVGLTYKNVAFKSHDGKVTLKGWEMPAATSTNKWIITSHGYTGNRLIWPTNGSPKGTPGLDLFKFLHDNGYNVLTFDYRNSGASGGTTTTVGYYEQQDLLGAIDALLKENPNAQIGLMGWSQGAATTLLTAYQSPAVKVAVADSSFSNLGSYLNTNLTHWSHLPSFPFNPLILKLWVPLSIHINPNNVSPIQSAEKYKGPLLLIASTSDGTIPYTNSQSIYQATEQGNVTFDLFHGPDHTMEFVDQPAAYEKDVLDFFKKNNF
ncbi:alpha/beta fold hydrolase [Pullulanibacillus sp. KACC 23026]|uniref:alpha/beta hydrolase n=1 Tax=Pullulanibacillus sp. KACC 23026 TaxID=3028315 RepID=UPI0023B155B1|nr:alpha/beta fold hydrolase [Pullulanibacillus sp. KACC 23026]WEG14361.1 alpha/beta fold hydrolase [Pullulanibacillus sp. KACC 23026]